jgi:hypothetical protein
MKKVIRIYKYTLDYIIAEIKKNIPILTVVEESSLQLKKQGRNYFGICPFHGEKTPSFSVNVKKNIFKCFGCGVSGDQIKLYALLNGIENGQAISILKKRFGLSEKRLTKEKKIEFSKRLEDKLLEEKFEQECKSLFDYLCSLRDLMRAIATTYADIEQVEQDILLISYYHESAYYEQLIHELVAVLFDEMNFERQIDIYKIAKGVVEDWKQLMEKQKPIYSEKVELLN